MRDRPAPVAGWSRLVRSVVLGGSSMLLAGLAHLLGGGQLPTPAVLTGTAGFLGLVATTVTARRCRFPLLVALLGFQQILLHLWLTAASQAHAICVTGPTGLGGGHDRHVVVGDGCLLTPSAAAGLGHGYGMWAAHAVAVVLTAWLLARGETWWWRTVERVVRAAPASVRPSEPTRHEIGADPIGLAGPAERSPAAPRGPPVLIAR